MSATTGFQPDESEFEPVPDHVMADLEEAMSADSTVAEPVEARRAGRAKRRFRLSRRWRPARPDSSFSSSR